MKDYRMPVEARSSITRVSQLQREQHLQLLADLLGFFQSGPEKPDTRRMRELSQDERFNGYPAAFLKGLVNALVACGLLLSPPHQLTRAASYMTSVEGLRVRALFLKRLEG